MRRALVPFLFVAALVPFSLAQPKKPDAKNQPRVIVAVPLSATSGATTRFTLRGIKLDTATDVQLPDKKGTVKVLKKSKAAVPNMQTPEKVGDTELQIELALPADLAEETITLVAVTPEGNTAPYQLLVSKPGAVVAEKEPNPGFSQPQAISVPATVEGAIASNQDVDVFRIEGKSGQKLVVEVLAARQGSPVDSFLTVHDDRGNVVAMNDDAEGTDARVELSLPRDGAYFISVLDAHDQGGPAHVYRLVVRPK